MRGPDAVYTFHACRVDAARRLLLRSGRPVNVTAKVFDLLLVLLRSRERVITRDELMERLWPDTVVEDGNLSVGISALRKALGSGPDGTSVIETLPRVGYRFVADVREDPSDAALRGGPASTAVVSPRAEPSAPVSELPAKMSCPDTAGVVPRERLFCTLDELSRSPITWLHAPAGSGKTTLLSSYLRIRRAPVLWYDVDAGDADASSVFHYTRLGAQALLGREIELPVPRPGSPEGQRVFMRRFFEALFRELPPGSHVVFDNYQEAALESAYNEMFRELCSAITPRVRILVASRVAPPPALARFRASGDMQLLTSHELRLDEHEIQHVLSRSGGSSQSSARLRELTDGWAVAVSLLAKVSLGPANLKASALRPPEDNLQGIFDFLAGEVFERLDASTRELLLEIALLPSFTAAMAVELSGRSDAVALLSKLHRDYLLVERHEQGVFRLHDLLRMFLLQRGALERDEQTRITLYHRAALLLADNDQFPAAADLLAASRNWVALGDLVEKHAPMLASQGRVATFGAALQSMPAAERDGRAWLVYWRAVSVFGYASGADALAESAFHAFRAVGDTPGALMSWALLVHAAVLSGDDLHPLDRWLRVLEEMALTPPTLAIAAKVELSKVIAHMFRLTPAMVAVADAAIPVVIRHGTADERVLVCGFSNVAYLFAGDAQRARDVQRLALVQLSAHAPDAMGRLIYQYHEAVRALASARPRAALRAAEHCCTLAENSGLHAWDFWLLSAGALAAIALRDFTVAEQMSDAMTHGPENQHNLAHGLQAYVRGWLAFEREDLAAARSWNGEALRLFGGAGFPIGSLTVATAQVIYEGTNGNAAALRMAIARLDSCLGPRPSAFHSIAADLAKIYSRLCRGELVQDSLREALVAARQQGYGVFLGSRVISRLVAAAFEYGIELEQAAELQQSYELVPMLDGAPSSSPALVTASEPAPAPGPMTTLGSAVARERSTDQGHAGSASARTAGSAIVAHDEAPRHSRRRRRRKSCCPERKTPGLLHRPSG